MHAVKLFPQYGGEMALTLALSWWSIWTHLFSAAVSFCWFILLGSSETKSGVDHRRFYRDKSTIIHYGPYCVH